MRPTFFKAVTRSARERGAATGVPHLAAIGAPVAFPAQAFFWVSLLAAMPRVTIARAGELVIRIVNLSVPRVSLAGEPLGSTIQRSRNFLFRSHWRLCWRRHNCLFSTLSKRWAAFSRSRNSGLWCGTHGDRGHPVFPRTSILAAYLGDHTRDYWVAFVAPLKSGC